MPVSRSGTSRPAGAEEQVCAEMAALALACDEYDDLVDGLLDLLQRILPGPLLCLCLQEVEAVGFYARVRPGTDGRWGRDVAELVADLQRSQMQAGGPGAGEVMHSRLQAPPVLLQVVGARSRSGRSCLLTVGHQETRRPVPADDECLARLAPQALLALDHALLLNGVRSMEQLDSLTGLANHRRLLEMLDYEILRHRHLDRTLSLLLLDVEGLDGINRSYGRGYGDHILSKLATLLAESVRPVDVIARSGMDEFAVVLPETDEDEARALAEVLSERLLDVRFAGGTVGLSVGAGQVTPGEMLSAEGFLQRGEQALHEVKRQERQWSARVAIRHGSFS